MPTNSFNEELVILPMSIVNMPATGMNNNNHAFNVRNRLFYALFYRITLGYTRIFPKSLRSFIEFVFLMKAVLSFFILVCVHINFSQMPANCLEHVKDVGWLRNGILRVEIIRPHQRFFAEQTGTLDDLFSVEKSYEREFKMKQLDTNDENASQFLKTFTKINNPETKRNVDIEPSSEELVGNNYRETSTPKTNFLFNYISFSEHANVKDDKKEIYSSTTSNWNPNMDELNFSPVNNSAQFRSTKYSNNFIKMISGIGTNLLIHSTTTKPLPNYKNESQLYNYYIFEYSLEYGLLRLSPNARNQLGIPVMLVPLESTVHKCFGDSIDQFFFEHLLGYDGLLLSSMISLAENEQNKGYLRNVITGEYYKLGEPNVSIWMARTSYITSFFIMIMFTMLISMFLRYSHYKIFVFVVDFLQLFDFHGLLAFPTAPLLTVILGLIGIKAILSEFFDHNTTAFYIILIVWIADQYDTICCYCSITKRHWLKFFYLYHFLFYAYHYRFNGQYSKLALICSWFFIQHSMIYFYHHYELPFVLEQAELQQVIIRRVQQQ